MDLFGFTRRAAAKLIELARRDEATPPPLTARTGGGPKPRGPGLWAEITAVGTAANAGLHSIRLLQLAQDDPNTDEAEVFEGRVPEFTVEFAARETNDLITPPGTIVQLRFAGYKADSTDPLYMFDRPSLVLQAEIVTPFNNYLSVRPIGSGSLIAPDLIVVDKGENLHHNLIPGATTNSPNEVSVTAGDDSEIWIVDPPLSAGTKIGIYPIDESDLVVNGLPVYWGMTSRPDWFDTTGNVASPAGGA